MSRRRPLIPHVSEPWPDNRYRNAVKRDPEAFGQAATRAWSDYPEGEARKAVEDYARRRQEALKD